MRALSKQLNAEFEAVSNTILELGSCFHFLYKEASIFQNETKVEEVLSSFGLYCG